MQSYLKKNWIDGCGEDDEGGDEQEQPGLALITPVLLR